MERMSYMCAFLLFALDDVHQFEQCEEDEVFYPLQNQKRECIKNADGQLLLNLSQRLLRSYSIPVCLRTRLVSDKA